MGIQRLSHIGMCVSDLEKSVAFYCEVLAFRELSRLKVQGEASETLLEVAGGKLEAVYLERDGTRIELLYYPDEGQAAGAPVPMNRPGFTHLSLRVTGFDEVVQSVEQFGGRRLEQTRVENPDWGTKAIFVTDPDGLRIELLEAPGDPDALPGT